MKIHEAAKKAAEENKLMIRKSVSEVFNGITEAIKPTRPDPGDPRGILDPVKERNQTIWIK